MAHRDTELYAEFLDRLQRQEHVPAALNEIKNLIQFKPANEVIPAIRSAGITKIVNCLNISDEAQIDLTCEVLKICFDKFDIGDVIKRYTGHIMYLLRHEKPCVRRLAVDEVYKCVTSDPGLLPLPQYIDIYVAVAQMVADTDITVANKAILITSNLPFEAYLKVLSEMKIALEYSVSSKCNAFEVVINISCKSVELFKLCTDLGYLDFMISELNSNDVLYQMNILELLSSLAIKSHGINYLVKNGAIQKIAEMIADLPNNPLGGLLTPGYIKFFGCIAHHYPKDIFEKYPVLLDTLFQVFESEDKAILPVALDTLGFVGATIEGKLCLAAQGAKFIQTVDKVAQLIRNSPNEIKVRALYCFAHLISVDNDPNAPKSGPIDHRVTLMTREWFRSLSSRPPSMETLFGICKNPFPDIKLAAFTFLNAVCQHQWGEELVAREAGFVEYLLDRSIDHTKQSKEAKFDVIKRLANSPAFDPNILQRLQSYVEQGPFYSDTTLQVAMEEGD
ncbi:26S proteasome non-ATPase regulatory subunit 5 [Amyelois transitella]|uniref:26S proteasome non-ATPase regulatory subunit 5 n=1 Tax=Amyelois transitella TaxID=680683 RepID=UPI00067C91B9|nr:26S proteasome non-ATPase regulatory subunit 5 [Amyelois transitella]